MAKKKNPHAVALGKMGGAKGGKARAAKLSAKRRRQIARGAIRALGQEAMRWAAGRSRLDQASCRQGSNVGVGHYKS